MSIELLTRRIRPRLLRPGRVKLTLQDIEGYSYYLAVAAENGGRA